MLFWALAATAAALILIIILILYRRQIRKISRDLTFLKNNRTNLRLTSELPLPEINDLIDSVNDVLDREKEKRRETQKEEAQLRETVTNLSHDIRTPLTSLDGYFQLLSASGSEEERRKYTAIIQSRIASLKDMLEELFTYARLQDAGYEMDLERTDFARCAFDTTFSFYDEFQKKGIKPEIDFFEGHLFIQGNEEGIRRAIQNMIKNALVHGQTSISLSLEQKDGRAVFSCSNDTANPQEIDMSQVFTRFYKADSARTHTSAGLGLSIAKGLVERMGGEISADLKENVFTVDIRFPVE